MDTKERILDVAERLFADSGFATTSLRDITSEAGVNLASVNYHFGSKEGLLLAVLTRRFAPVNERRLERLDELERAAAPGSPELADILRALFAPPFEMRAELGHRGDKFIRLLGRVHTETNDEFRKSFIELFNAVFVRFTAAIQRAVPQLDAAELCVRSWFAIGSMAYAMTWGATMVAEGAAPRAPEDLLESLIQFGAAGISAPARTALSVTARPRSDRRGRGGRA